MSALVLDLLSGEAVPGESLLDAAPLSPFAPEAVGFVGALSRAIMRSSAARRRPELIALAHWMRPAAIRDFETRFQAGVPEHALIAARGPALHFAPSNVDTIFLYSCVLSLLAGNPNVVRLSTNRDGAQTTILLDILREMLADEAHAPLRGALRFVAYDHDEAITSALSARAMLRVIWGGDETVQAIRAIPLGPLGRDVAFPNRWSVAVLDAEAVVALSEDALTTLAREFSNDGYWFHQMACSSPRAMIWRGDDAESAAAAKRFWPALRDQAARFAPDLTGTDFYRKRMDQDAGILDGALARPRPAPDNLVTVSELGAPDALRALPHGGAGYFAETRINALADLGALLDQRCQTIASFGISSAEWREALRVLPRLADRIAPVGHALAFGPIWDGMDLLTEFTRLIALHPDLDRIAVQAEPQSMTRP